jgi:hypothetical protein
VNSLHFGRVVLGTEEATVDHDNQLTSIIHEFLPLRHQVTKNIKLIALVCKKLSFSNQFFEDLDSSIFFNTLCLRGYE